MWQLREGGVRQGYGGWTESSLMAPGQVAWACVPSTFALWEAAAQSCWTFAAPTARQHSELPWFSVLPPAF